MTNNNQFYHSFQTSGTRLMKLVCCLLLLVIVSACSNDGPECKGAPTTNNMFWIEKTSNVFASTGKLPDHPEPGSTEGWTSANLGVVKGQKITFSVNGAINLCSQGVTKRFGPDIGNVNNSANNFYAFMPPYTANWSGYPVKKGDTFPYSHATRETSLLGRSPEDPAGNDLDAWRWKRNNGWMDTGIIVSGDSPVSYQVSGSYTPYLYTPDVPYPNFGWAQRAAKDSANSRTKDYPIDPDTLTVTKGMGLFVYIGPVAPPNSDWFGSELQGGDSDAFFELYDRSSKQGGFYGYPPQPNNPAYPNKIYVRYGSDLFNRPGNAAASYTCPSPSWQPNALQPSQDCFGSAEPEAVAPSAPYVWTNKNVYNAMGINPPIFNSYTHAEGGYTLTISYNCVGTFGRYLEAKIIQPDGTDYPISGFENKLLQGHGYFETTTPTSGNLYYRIVDEMGKGDGNGDYSDNISHYGVQVGTYIQPTDVGVTSEFLYKHVIKPVKDLFLGTNGGPSAAKSMYNKLLGQGDFANAPSIIVGTIRAMLILYIALYGLQYILGFIKDTKTDFFMRLLRIAIILQLTLPDSWEFFNTYLFNVFINGTDDLVRLFTSQFSGSLLMPNGTTSVTMNPDDPFAFINITIKLLGTSIFWDKVVALIWGGILGWTYIFLILASIYIFFNGIIYAIYTYLVAIIATALLLSVAPIFIAFGLFEKTRESFKNWLYQLINYAMQPVLLLTSLSIFNVFIYSALFRMASSTICKSCIINADFKVFNICLLQAYVPFTGESTDPSQMDAQVAGFMAVICLLIIMFALRKVTDLATTISANIFGANVNLAVSSKSAPSLEPAKNLARQAGSGALGAAADVTKAALRTGVTLGMSSSAKTAAKKNLQNASDRFRKGKIRSKRAGSTLGSFAKLAVGLSTFGIGNAAGSGISSGAKSTWHRITKGTWTKTKEEKAAEAAKREQKQQDELNFIKRQNAKQNERIQNNKGSKADLIPEKHKGLGDKAKDSVKSYFGDDYRKKRD